MCDLTQPSNFGVERAKTRGFHLEFLGLRDPIRLGHVELAKLLLSKGADAKKRGHNKNSLSAAELIRKRIADLTELKQSIETKDEQSSAHQSTNRSKSKSE